MKCRLFCSLFLSLVSAGAQGVKTEALPSADQIFKHYLDATGGVELHDSVKSEMSTGTFSMPSQNITGAMTVFQKAPNKMYTVIDIPNVGKIEDGTDGTIAWEVSAIQGARIKTGDEANAAIRQAALDLPTNWKKYYKSVEVIGTDTVNDKLCYKLLLTPLAGATETEYYEKDSGLLVKMSTIADTPMGKVPTDVLFSDYKKQGDMLVPMKNEVQVASQTFLIRTDNVTVNPDIPDSKFAIPADIKALQK